MRDVSTHLSRTERHDCQDHGVGGNESIALRLGRGTAPATIRRDCPSSQYSELTPARPCALSPLRWAYSPVQRVLGGRGLPFTTITEPG